MKKVLLVVSCIVVFILIFIYGLNELSWHKIPAGANAKLVYKNMQFLGKDSGHYYMGGAYQNQDGSLYLAAILTDRSRYKQYVSILKLSPDLRELWETKTRINKFSWKDLLPDTMRKDTKAQSSGIGGITLLNNYLYADAYLSDGLVRHPQILRFDLKGKLLQTINLEPQLEPNSHANSFIQGSLLYLAYLNHRDKALYLDKYDITTGKLVNRALKFYGKLKLEDIAFTLNPADTTTYITAYDYATKSSSFFVSKRDDIKEYFRTSKKTRINDLTYIGNTLYGTVKEDSLLEIIDLTNPDKPKILVTDVLTGIWTQGAEMVQVDGDYYIAVQQFKGTKKNPDMDVLVRKYTPDGIKAGEFLIHGQYPEIASELLVRPDNSLVALGTSFSGNPYLRERIFISKIKL